MKAEVMKYQAPSDSIKSFEEEGGVQGSKEGVWAAEREREREREREERPCHQGLLAIQSRERRPPTRYGQKGKPIAVDDEVKAWYAKTDDY